MSNIARPFIPWVGGKEKLVPYVRQVFPDNVSQYLEPFGGGGAVLLSLPPNPKRLDIYNDLDSELVNLFLCVRERTNALLRELKFLPIHSRVTFERYRDFLEHKEVMMNNILSEMAVLNDRECFTEEQAAELMPIFKERMELYDVQRAAAFYNCIRGSFSGTMNSFGVKAFDVERFLYLISAASVRLKDVVIENKNALDIIHERDRPNGLIYCDPPYYQSEKGFYIGKDRFGANILVDLDRRSSDKTNPSVLVLGNSGQGKSYLLKLLICNIRESGKSVICLDAEHEMADLSTKLNGCFVDLMSGEYRINPLEPKLWDSDSRSTSRLSQHISFLKDFFRSYRDFSDQQIDTIELMLERLYAKWEMNDSTDFSGLKPTDYPIFSDLYDVLEDAYQNYDERDTLYTRESLRDILLGLHSMCRGSESRFFNGHTNIISDRFLVFGVKDLLSDSNQKVKDAMLFNILSYFNNKLLTEGNTMAVLDELHVWLSNPIAIEYIRNALKRARKRNSGLMLASQNLEDFMLPGVAEMTRPLFSIPTHQFIFNTGSVDKRFYMEHLQMEPSEYEHIQQPKQGQCFYKCGNDRHLLQVKAPEHKEALFGNGGGK